MRECQALQGGERALADWKPMVGSNGKNNELKSVAHNAKTDDTNNVMGHMINLTENIIN